MRASIVTTSSMGVGFSLFYHGDPYAGTLPAP
jgi:hypothetical protein